jgi:subfamily B ATP-binding cassette protein MsbA
LSAAKHGGRVFHAEEEDHHDELQPRRHSLREILARLLPLLRPHRKRLLIGLLFVLYTAGCLSAMPLIGMIFLDFVLPTGQLGWALLAGAGFVFVGTTRVTSWYLAMYILTYLGQDLVFRFRQNGFRHLQSLCLRFHDKFPSGFLYSRVFEQAIDQVGMFLRQSMSSVVVHLVGLMISMVFCVLISAPMTAVILLGAGSYVFIAQRLSPRIYRSQRSATDAHNRIAGFILDKLRGTKTIQAFSMEPEVQERFDRVVWPMQEKWITARMDVIMLQMTTEGTSYLIHAIVWVVGAAMIFGEHLGIGALVAFVGYQRQMTQTIGFLANTYGQMTSARSGFDLYSTVLDTQPTVVDEPSRQMPDPVEGRIELRNVTFSYTDVDVLTDVSVEVPPGQRVALVGRSGGGKSTIANLLMRFYDPNEGQVLLDGIDVRQLPLRSYRRLFGTVLQDPFLFDDTIRENLRCAKPDATDDDIREVLRKAKALEFVEAYPDGLDHRVGEGGHGLSGGQRQRISIARCMLMEPRFLLLDEATSALDNETEAIIQNALESLFENKTVFVIAHRLSTIRRSDRILVVEQGRIVEDGTFDGLLARDGLFRHLYSIATSTSTLQMKIDEAGFA